MSPANGLSGYCATMLSPGAAWQCVLVRHALFTEATVFLMDRYQESVRQYSVRLPRRTLSLSADAELAPIDTPTFRLMRHERKGQRSLSGFIEQERGDSLLWDIQLTPVLQEPGLRLCRCQARLSMRGEEYLFPSASSFLVTQGGLFATGAGLGADPQAAFCMTSHGGALQRDGARVPLPLSGEFSADEPAPDDVAQLIGPEAAVFRIPLSRHSAMETRLGRWALSAYDGLEVPGFLLSVIEM